MTPRPRLVARTELAEAEITLERLDPLSAAAARPVTTGAAILIIAIPVVSIAVKLDEIVQPAWLALSFAALVAVAWLLLDRSRVYRPLWKSSSAQTLQLLLVVMTVASVMSTLTANAFLRDDWAPYVIGVVLIALAPYRPAREIAFWAAVHTLICAVLGMGQGAWAVSDVPTLTFAVTSSLGVALLGFAAAAFARSLNGDLRQWHDRAWASAEHAVVQQRTGVARSVQQQRITLLNREVVPYLSSIVGATELDDGDRDEARRLARSIRALLVADVERSWAQTLLDELIARHPQLNIEAVADDPENAGGASTLEQRTLVRAIADVSIRRLAATRVELQLRAPQGRLSVRCEITTPLSMTDARRELRGMIEIVRGLTESSRVIEREGRIALEFEYGY